MSEEQINQSATAPNTGTSHSVKAGRLDMGDAVDNLLIDLNAPEETEDKREDSDEVTAAESATKSNSSDGFKDAIDGAEDILAPEEASEPEDTEEATEEATQEEPEQETSEEPQAAAEEEDEGDDEDVVMFATEDGTEVTLDELKRGYLRQSDYTKKTQEVADHRQQLGQGYQALEQQQQVLAQNLELALNVVEPQLAQFATLNWDALSQSDPYEYAEKRALYDQAQIRYQHIAQAAGDLVAQNKQRTEVSKKQMLAAERQKLAMALPDMADPTKGRQLAGAIKEYSLSQGLSEAEASNIVDHRMIVMLNKARLYDELNNTKLTAAQKKMKKGPRKVVTGGQPTTKQERSASDKAALRKKLAKTGSVDDGVEWLLKG